MMTTSTHVRNEIDVFDAISTSDVPPPNGNGTATDYGHEESGGSGLLINIIIFYYPPLIVLLGTVGNLLSLAVFRCTKLRQLSTSCYLTALSLSDTGCLLPYFATWLEIVGVNVYNRPISCQLLTYLFYVCGFMSPWFVVAFTVERFVATCYPLRRASICTVSRAQGIVLALVFIAILSYVYILFVTGIDEASSQCYLKQDHLDAMHVLNFLDTVATLVVPGVLITALNVLIARAVLQIEKVRCTMLSTTMTTTTTSSSAAAMAVDRSLPSSDDEDDDDGSGGGGLGGGGGGGANRQSKTSSTSTINKRSTTTFNSARSYFVSDARTTGGTGTGTANRNKGIRCCYQMKITKMLLLISTVFVVLNAPSYTVRLWVYFAESRSDSDNVVLYNLQQWSQLPFNLNFAINFLLYCVSGQNFRRSLKSLFWRLLGRFGGGNHRFGRGRSFNSSKRTMTTVHSLHTTATINVKDSETQDLSKAATFRAQRQLSDETTDVVVIVVDSV